MRVNTLQVIVVILLLFFAVYSYPQELEIEDDADEDAHTLISLGNILPMLSSLRSGGTSGLASQFSSMFGGPSGLSSFFSNVAGGMGGGMSTGTSSSLVPASISTNTGGTSTTTTSSAPTSTFSKIT